MQVTTRGQWLLWLLWFHWGQWFIPLANEHLFGFDAKRPHSMCVDVIGSAGAVRWSSAAFLAARVVRNASTATAATLEGATHCGWHRKKKRRRRMNKFVNDPSLKMQ